MLDGRLRQVSDPRFPSTDPEIHSSDRVSVPLTIDQLDRLHEALYFTSVVEGRTDPDDRALFDKLELARRMIRPPKSGVKVVEQCDGIYVDFQGLDRPCTKTEGCGLPYCKFKR